jgi:hypothetical protein
LEKLNDRERRIVQLSVFDDLTYQETGDVLGISPTRVREFMERIIIKLNPPNTVRQTEKQDVGPEWNIDVLEKVYRSLLRQVNWIPMNVPNDVPPGMVEIREFHGNRMVKKRYMERRLYYAWREGERIEVRQWKGGRMVKKELIPKGVYYG